MGNSASMRRESFRSHRNIGSPEPVTDDAVGEPQHPGGGTTKTKQPSPPTHPSSRRLQGSGGSGDGRGGGVIGVAASQACAGSPASGRGGSGGGRVSAGDEPVR